jgi:hypothetical protein
MSEEKASSEKENPQPEHPTGGGLAGFRKRRRHGYRGYPLGSERGSGIHIGRGFAGVEPLGAAGGMALPEAGLLTEATKKGTSKS